MKNLSKTILKLNAEGEKQETVSFTFFSGIALILDEWMYIDKEEYFNNNCICNPKKVEEDNTFEEHIEDYKIYLNTFKKR